MKTIKKPYDCSRVRELLFDYYEDTLNSAEEAAVREHLASCKACEEEYAGICRMMETLEDCSEAPPSSLYGAVMEKISTADQDGKILTDKKRRLIPVGSILTACAVVMMLVVGRHVIFGGRSLDAAREDQSTVSDIMRYSEADNSEPTDISAESASEPEVTNYAEDEDDGDFVTSAISVSAPLVEAPEEAPSIAEAPPAPTLDAQDTTDVSYSGESGDRKSLQNPSPLTADAVKGSDFESLIDAVYDVVKADGDAVIVCRRSLFGYELPQFVGEKTIADVDVLHYAETHSAKESFIHYIELLITKGVYHRSAFPRDNNFSSCQIYLLNDSE